MQLIRNFEGWAMRTDGKPYDEKNKAEAMKKIGLTETEFSNLLFITAAGWVF
ncbi:MAG: hypothetical protein J1E39_02855 [Eubacterium sp.]|nr:hypothetical protein [Eubacterium sp.]